MTRESKKHSALYFLYEFEEERIKKCNKFIDEIFDKYEALEQRNAELESQLSKSKHLSEQLLIENNLCSSEINSLEQRIKELEEKDKIKNCEECYDKVSLVLKREM